MLPEPLFKDRKRDSNNNRRPTTSYNRQSGSYYEGNGHGCTPPRPSNGKYNGGRGSFRRSPYYIGEPRSVAVQVIPTSLPPPLKDVHNKNSGGDDQRLDVDRDQFIGCKSLEVEISARDLGKLMLASSVAAAAEDEMPRKRLRLTWGQGLAKYEKEKVEGSMNSESSLKVAGSMSPATPCSVAACLTPEDRPFSKAKDVDKDTSHHSETLALGPSNCLEGLHIKLDQLPPIYVLTSLLDDLLQPEDACTGDSTFARNAATKLVLFKADISKELEKTECEIDLLENELKSLNDGGCNLTQISFSLQDESSSIPCPESIDASATVSSDLIPVISSAMAAVKQPYLPVCSSGKHEFEVKHANNDIPQIVLSSNGESTSSGNLEQPSLDLGERAVAANDSGDSNHSGGGGSSSGSNVNLDMSSHGNEDNNLIHLIITSNRDASRRASQAFDRALPTAPQEFDIWGSDRILSCRKNDMHIREKLALQEHQIKFKERILALKFRALNHLWKEDLKLLSVRKQRTKSQKRFDLCSRSSHSSLQKHRSSIRSRSTLSAGNLSLVPTVDIVDFTSKLLSESQIKLYRINLKMPALVLDEERSTRFITKNNLTEDPLSIEKERSMINPWALKEKEVFMKKLATLGKDFAKISSFLNHKTTADCIEFYYKNHKSESFTDVKKQLNLRKQSRCLPTNAYMVTSGRKWNRDSNAASLDMLGAVSVAVAHYNDNRRNQPKYSARSIVLSYHSAKVSRGSYGTLVRANSTGISGGEKEIAGTDVLAGEAVSSSVTSSICPLEKMNVVRLSRPSTPEVTETIEEEATCSDEGCGGLESVDWTDEEKSLFISALGMYGKDFARISHCVGTKSRKQCKTFYSKARKCLGLDQIYAAAGNGGTLVSDANVGRSDTDAAEIDSAVCSTVLFKNGCGLYKHSHWW